MTFVESLKVWSLRAQGVAPVTSLRSGATVVHHDQIAGILMLLEDLHIVLSVVGVLPEHQDVE